MKFLAAIKQIPVYIEKNFRILKNRKDWKIIVIAAVISIIACFIVGKDMFETYEDTKMGFFAVCDGMGGENCGKEASAIAAGQLSGAWEGFI